MRVQSPVPGFNGVVAGVVFVDGEADSESGAALGYFARHGYYIGVERPATVTELDADAVAQIEAHGGKIETRGGEQVVVIPVRLIDAEITASRDPEPPASESDLEGAVDDQVPLVPLDRPSNNASTEMWATYAVSLGADPDTAAALKRDELIANYGQEA